MSVPKKGDIVINPKTSRPVKVGSRVWLKLVKEGIFSGHYTDNNEIETIDNNRVEEQINEANQKLPINEQAVRGRGKYKGKIVRRQKQPALEDVSRYATDIAKKVVNENINELKELDEEDIDDELERLIMAEMVTEMKPKKKIKIKFNM